MIFVQSICLFISLFCLPKLIAGILSDYVDINPSQSLVWSASTPGFVIVTLHFLH